MEDALIQSGTWILKEATKAAFSRVVDSSRRRESNPALTLICKLRTDRDEKTHVDVEIWNNTDSNIHTSPVKFDLEEVRGRRLRSVRVDFSTQPEGFDCSGKLSIPANDFLTVSYSPGALVACLRDIPDVDDGRFLLRPLVVAHGQEIACSGGVFATKG